MCGLFTYCSPASWPQSQSEVSVESAGAWGEEEVRQTLKARKKKKKGEEDSKAGTVNEGKKREKKKDRAHQSQGMFRKRERHNTRVEMMHIPTCYISLG